MLEKIFEKISLKKKNFILFIFILTVISSISVFRCGVVLSHDVAFHLHRIIAIVDNIRIGKYVPVYFNYLNGFGYANGLFYPDFFLIIPAFFCYIGLDVVSSLRIFVVIINFFSIYTIYLCVYRITKEKKCAYISMILYGFSVYRLLDYVERGAIGEFLSFVFFPLFLLGIYELLYGNYKKSYYLAIGLSCVCLSHVISFYLSCFFLFLLVLFNFKCFKNRKRLLYLFINLLLSALVTVHFWLPLLEQIVLDEFNFLNIDVFQNIIPFVLLFIDAPVFVFLDNWYPSSVGLIYYVGIVLYFLKLKRNNFVIRDRFLLSIFVLGFLSIILSCCTFFWNIHLFYNIFKYIQFPWRFYIFATIFLVVGFSILLKELCFNKLIKTCFIYTILVFIMNSVLYSLGCYVDFVNSNQIMLGEYLPKNFKIDIIEHYSNDYIDYEHDNNILKVTVVKDTENVELPLIFYRGYKACNEKVCYDVFKTENGLVGVNNNKFTSFNVFYEGTLIYRISRYFSFFGVLAFIFFVYKCNSKSNEL